MDPTRKLVLFTLILGVSAWTNAAPFGWQQQNNPIQQNPVQGNQGMQAWSQQPGQQNINVPQQNVWPQQPQQPQPQQQLNVQQPEPHGFLQAAPHNRNPAVQNAKKNDEKPWCPNGFIGWQEDCYYFYAQAEALTWYQAQRACRDKGANLVSIHSKQENEFVFQEIQKLRSPQPWIGMRKEEGDKTDASNFHWVDGSKGSYDKWEGGEPGGEWERPGCVEMYRDKEGAWRATHCLGMPDAKPDANPDAKPDNKKTGSLGDTKKTGSPDDAKKSGNPADPKYGELDPKHTGYICKKEAKVEA